MRPVAHGNDDHLVHQVTWRYKRSFSIRCQSDARIFHNNALYTLVDEEEVVTCLACLCGEDVEPEW